MARPKKNNRKTERVTVRLALGEKGIITGLATRAGVSESELLRSAALNLKLKPRFTDQEWTLIKQLASVAINLNQLAKGVNSGSQLFTEIKQQVEEIRHYLNS